MTLTEALAELGLTESTTVDKARRCYLRLLKTRKPEVDPVGFKRLREAYEIAKEALDQEPPDPFEHFSSPPRPPPPPPPAKPAPPPPPSKPAPPPPTRTETEGKSRTADSPPPPTAESPKPESESPKPEPESPKPEPESPKSEPEEETRPSAATAEEATGTREAVEKALAEAFKQAAVIEDPSEWRLMKRAFELATRHVGVATPPIITCIETELALLALGQLGSANELHESVTDWLKTVPSETRIFEGGLLARWTLLNELRALSAQAPRKVWVAVTRAVLDGTAQFAVEELAEFKHTNPTGARNASEWWKKHTKLLSAELTPLYDRIPPQPKPPPEEATRKKERPGASPAQPTPAPTASPPYNTARKVTRPAPTRRAKWPKEKIQTVVICVMAVIIVVLTVVLLAGGFSTERTGRTYSSETLR